MTKEKSITGGEVTMRSANELIIEELAKDEKLRAVHFADALFTADKDLPTAFLMMKNIAIAAEKGHLKTTGEDEKGVDLDAVKREVAQDSSIIPYVGQQHSRCSGCVERAIDHLASTGRIRGEWRPISEAPRDGTRVLVWSDELYMKPYISWWGVDHNAPEDGNEQEEWLTGDGDSWSTGYYYTPCKPTHWMPLPPAPKTDGVQEDLDRSTMERK